MVSSNMFIFEGYDALHMKNLHYLGLFFFVMAISLPALAQQGLMPVLPETDSVQMELKRQMEYNQLIMGLPAPELLNGNIKMPRVNFMDEFKNRYTLRVNPMNSISLSESGFTPGWLFPVHSPFFVSGQVLSQAAYQLGDKFVLGGYSYGVNSLFTAPLPGNTSNFDRYGSTMFLQYKVSKNFKIETRVNVTQGAPPGF